MQLGTISATYDVLGRRTSLTDSSGTTTFLYDGLSRLSQVNTPQTGTVRYAHNSRNLRTSVTTPDGTQIVYDYRADGQLERVRHLVTPSSTTLATYSYDNSGRVQSVARSNGATTTYTYDDADRLVEQHTTVGGTTVNRFSYTLDRVGLRTGLNETLGNQTKAITYTYDGLLRLTGALENPGSVSTSTDDLAGNRTFAQRDNQVLDVAQYLPTDQRNDWAYDLAGNVIHDDTEDYTQYSYDALNRMTTQVTMGVTTTHTYNGDGVLVAQTTNGATTRYVQDLASDLEQILSDGTTTFVYGNGAGRLLGITSSGTKRWYSTDALFSVRQLLDNSGAVLTALDYDPWGQRQGSPISGFGFTGELQQGHLVYLRARW